MRKGPCPWVTNKPTLLYSAVQSSNYSAYLPVDATIGAALSKSVTPSFYVITRNVLKTHCAEGLIMIDC